MIEPILWYWWFAIENHLNEKEPDDPYKTPSPFDEPDEDTDDFDSDYEEE